MGKEERQTLLAAGDDEEQQGKSKSVTDRRVLIVSAGASHSVALLSGNVVCSWGRGEDGQLGHGDAEDRYSPVQLSALDEVEVNSITCGADHTLVYSESRLQVYSWGWGDFGRLGHGNSSDLFIPQPIRVLDTVKIKQIACGDCHCLAVSIDGNVVSWGRNQNGQLGLGTAEDSLVPQKIQTFEGISVKMLAAGAEHSAAVTESGEIYGWGWGRYGNLGLGDRSDRLVPEKVSSIEGTKMVMVACGWRHTISVTTAGTIYTYGWSKYGQLGHGDFEDHLIPHKLEALSDKIISQISGGWRHTMAVTSDGKLYGWGWNKLLVADGQTENPLPLILMEKFSNEVIQEKSRGFIVNRTKQQFGQVGVGDNADRCSPVQVVFPHDQKVVQICCGWRHTLAITDRNNVFSWGRGTNGQLGHGESSDRNSPKIIDALSADGDGGQMIETSKAVPLAGKKALVPPSDRYAVVPDESVQGPGGLSESDNGGDASVPENAVKRMRVDAGPA